MTNVVNLNDVLLMHKTWLPDSWKNFPVAQEVHYQNPRHLVEVLKDLARSPEIATFAEIERLKTDLNDVAAGSAFVFQAGDCAERFQDCNESSVAKKMELLNLLANEIHQLTDKRIIIIARIAGQFFKPRSIESEKFQGASIPVFRGEGINSFDLTSQSRQPDADRLHLAYLASFQAKKIFLNHARCFPNHSWYTSHEGMHLPYEEALLRLEPRSHQYYAASAHFLWIGDRTRSLTGAHVEFFRGLINPVGIKIGPRHEVAEAMPTR